MAYVVRRAMEYLAAQDDESTPLVLYRLALICSSSHSQAILALMRLDYFPACKPDPKILRLTPKRKA